MSITVIIDMKRDFVAPCSLDNAFEVLSDVPRSVSHFPDVHALVDMNDNVYRWEMKKIGVGKVSVQTVYACKYTHDRNGIWVKWTPVEGIGNGRVSGQWEFLDQGDGTTRILFQTRGELTMPIPKMLKRLVEPVVIKEFNGLVDRYLANLQATFRKLD